MPEISTAVSSKVSYEKTGSGPVLVLLHGFPESSSLWRNVAPELSKSFTLIMPDFPGSGKSPLEKETSIADMADCVADILKAEGITKAVVAGHSMGGYVAFAFAVKYSDKLAGLSVVHSTPLADDEERKKIRLKAIDVIEKGGKSAFVRQMVTNLFAEDFKQNHPEVVEEQIALAMETDEKALVNYYKAMIGRPDQSFWLQNTSIPIQWIVGMNDNVIPYKKILPQCAISAINFVTFYHNCGHMSMLEMPALPASDLTEFVNYCYRQR
jgi:pimeloyl-ACP methyl ester carboxylesterase